MTTQNVEEIQKQIDTLKIQHAELDKKITELDNRAWLSPDEQVERKNMQKRKLKLKDQIHNLQKQIDNQ